jgi:hypothetical protein
MQPLPSGSKLAIPSTLETGGGELLKHSVALPRRLEWAGVGAQDSTAVPWDDVTASRSGA